MIYLDNAATTQVSPEVLKVMLPYFSEDYGNPGSVHPAGAHAAAAIRRAREQCADSVHAAPDNIIFTSGGSEANTLAIVGLAEHLKKIGKTHIVTTNVEHPSVLRATKYLFGQGFNTTYCAVDSNGALHVDDLTTALRDDTGLVSVMAMNNETGNSYPIQAIGELCRERGILFHTDCVQAFGSRDIDVERQCIDFLSVSGHKFHAPKGCGFLYARDRALLVPVIHGGGQEYGLRSGTENVPTIAGLGFAAEAASQHVGLAMEHYRALQRAFFGELTELQGVTINGLPRPDSKTINLRFDGVDGETLLLFLGSQGIMVSAGSACSAHSAVPSRVLKALGLTDEEARSSIRISFSQYTTVQEARQAGETIAGFIDFLRAKEE